MAVQRPRIPYGRQLIEEDDIREVVDCLRGDFLTQGPRVRGFEDALCEATGAAHAVAVCNGTAALHLAAVALGVRKGDIGVVPAVTFLSSAHCLRYCDADVEFVDVEPDTGLVSLASLETTLRDLGARGRSPKVVVPVDLTGQPADWSRVNTLARRSGARVLLDAAHSLGATAEMGGAAKRVGESGADAVTLSFHPVKHVTTAEGGAVLTNDEGLYRDLVELRTFGMHKDPARFERDASDPFVGPWYYETKVLAFNYRLSDIHSALGSSQLKKLSRFVGRRREIARAYDAALDAPPLRGRLSPLRRHAGRESAYHLYVAQVADAGSVESTAAERRKLFLHLAERDIHCQVHYVPLPWQPYYRALAGSDGGVGREYPGAAGYYAASLSLPMFPRMENAEIDRVIEALRQWAE